MIRTGMSGFSYPEWIGEVYPEGTKRAAMLATYTTIFPVVEINMTFRRRPVETTIKKWRDAVGDDFRFIMKASAGITHYRRLAGPKDEIDAFLDGCAALGPTFGGVLFQLPPNLKFDADLIDGFGAKLRPGGNYAIEPRNETFFTDEAFDIFRRHGIALCLNDALFEPSRYVHTGPFVYFRFHKEMYVAGDLELRAELARRYAAEGLNVYAIFQHEDNPESVKPALRFLDLIAR